MKYDPYSQDLQYFVDQEHYMMNTRNADWDPNGDNGKGDAIGRNFFTYFVYDDEKLVHAVKKCWTVEYDKRGFYLQGYRYPTHDRKDMSRDHVLNTALIYHLHEKREKHEMILEPFVRLVRWRISDKFMFSPTLWFYIRALAGMKWALPLFYICIYLEIGVAVLLNLFIINYGEFGEEYSQDDFIKEQLTEKQRILRRFMYPLYTLRQVAFMLYFLKDSWVKRGVQKMCSYIVPKHNYVMQLLLKTKRQPTQEQVYSYKAMNGGRWTTYLNKLTDRDVYVIKDKYPEKAKTLLRANVVDVDLVRKLYEEKKQKLF